MLPKIIVFTDLDSTLLDTESYSWEPAHESLNELRKIHASLVMVSSKTFSEMVDFHHELEFKDPFIVENGGGIALDTEHALNDYIKSCFDPSSSPTRDDFSFIPLGKSYHEIVSDLDVASSEAEVKTRGFSSMTEKEVGLITGLPLSRATKAKQRDFDEPFLLEGGTEEINRLQKVVAGRNLKMEQGGRFWHLFSHRGKGAAVSMLQGLFRSQYRDIYCIGLGDSPNDFSFLELMDAAVLLGNDASDLGFGNKKQKIWTSKEHGPEQWNAMILKLLSEIEEVL